VPWEPLHVVESLNINELVGTQCRQSVQGIVPCVGEVRSDGSGDLMALEEVHNLMTLSLKVGVHVPNRCKAMEMLWIVLAQEIDNEVDTVWGLLLLDFLG